METEEDKSINPTRFLAKFVESQTTKEVIEKLLNSEVAKTGSDHNLYPISKY
jgi:hypothetical protein